MPLEYIKEADLAIKTPNIGAIINEMIHPIQGMLPIVPTIMVQAKIRISHKIYVPQPIAPITSTISPAANTFGKLSCFAICTKAIVMIMQMKNISKRPTINIKIERIPPTFSKLGNMVPEKVVRRKKGAIKIKGTSR